MPDNTFPIRTALAAVLAAGAFAVTAAPARAETVRATLTYTDGDGSINPIRFAKVEIHRRAPGCCTIWGWEQTVFTDGNGFFSTTVPFIGAGTTTGLRVFATNDAAQVMTQDFLIPFYRQPGLPGPEIQPVTASASDTLVFDFNFNDDWARNHFNIADAIKRARDYALARRDPNETDPINRVDVHFNSVTTYYDPVLHAVRLTPNFALDDFTIIHEYTHNLEEQIGSFYGIASTHNGCTAMVGAVDVRGPGLAWMEGFASYLPQAINRAMPGVLDGPSSGSLPVGFMESPFCSPMGPANATEVFVAGALLDLDDGIGAEFFDEHCDRDTEIFQIFDRELDLGWTNPTIDQFIDAWLARGLDAPQLLASMAANGITHAIPTSVTHYDTVAADNFAIYRPSTAQWWVLGGANGIATFGGVPGDVPVPADYDGDGLTDLGIWRPGAVATWFVKSSMGGLTRAVSLGTTGDVPLPADYDNDGEVDLAMYRPSTGQLTIFGDTCNEGRTVTLFYVAGGIPIVGNFGGDARVEAGLYDPATGWIYARTVIPSGATFWVLQPLGNGNDLPVMRDYTGDGRTDLGLYEPDTGNFVIKDLATNVTTTTWWGYAGEKPVSGDFDGDGKADLATWNPTNGWWYVRRSSNLTEWDVQWGINLDVAVPAP